MKRSLAVFRAADPVRHVDFQVVSAGPVFDELADAIVAGEFESKDEEFESEDTPPIGGVARSRFERAKRPRVTALMTIAAALVLLAFGLTYGLETGRAVPKDSLPSGARITPFYAARLLPTTLLPPANQSSAAKWQLVSLVVDQGWQVNTTGPPPSRLTCPTVTACYALAVRYASPNAAKPESVSLYVSSDLGTTWAVLPMPARFLPTSQLSCPNDRICAVGGTQGGQPAFAVTVDGGHQWGVVSMSGTESLQKVVCRSAEVCVGILGSPEPASSNSSIVTTDNGGTSWTPASVPISGTVLALSCPTDRECVAVGYPGLLRGPTPIGFVFRSDDGGQSWTTGTLPQNFGFVPPLTAVSCVDADNCMAIGDTSIVNPQRCQGTPPRPPRGDESCSTAPNALNSMIVTSSDGGATWHTRPLPDDIPSPQLFGLSCASATVCWASGQEAVPQVIGNVHDEGSPVMVGTTNGGVSWFKTTFSVPGDAPNYLGQSYLAIGDITCPATSACLALGVAAQSAPSTPVYRYENGAP